MTMEKMRIEMRFINRVSEVSIANLLKIYQMTDIQSIIEAAWSDRSLLKDANTLKAIEFVIAELDKGRMRVAEPLSDGNWQVNDWIKKAVILYFPRATWKPFMRVPWNFTTKCR